MTYRGPVQNHVVVLECNPPLENGTIVHVEPVDASSEPQHRYSGTRQGERRELGRLLREVQAMRDTDLRLSGNPLE